MFNLFKSHEDEFTKQVNKLFADMEQRWFDQIQEAQTLIPKVVEGKDTVTVTFKGPNVVTTITTNKALLPDVLKDLGLTMPKTDGLDLGAHTEKRVTKQRKAPAKK